MAEDDNKLGTTGLTDTIKKLRTSINKTTDTGLGKDQFLKAQAKAEEIETKLFEAEQAGDDERAAAIRKQLSGVQAALEKGPMNLKTLEKRMEELDAINENLEKAEKRQEDRDKILKSQIARDETVSSLSQLNKSLKDQTDRMESKTDAQKSIEKLQGFFGASATEESNKIKEAFDLATRNLENAITDGNDDAIELATKQLEAVKDAAESEEKRREAIKAQEEANDSLLKTAEGVKNLGTKFDDFASSAASGVGFIATLGGLALLFLDPEKFAELIGKIIDNITTIFSGIYDLFTGDIEGGLNTIKDNLGLFAAALGGILLFLGGPLLRGLAGLLKVAKVVRTFILGAWVPGMLATLKGMMVSFMAMLTNPVALAVAGIAAAFTAVGLFLNHLKESMGFTSVFDVISLGIAHVNDALAHFGNFFITIAKKIGELASGVLEMFGYEVPEFIQNLADTEYLDTDSAEKKKKELLAKAEEAKLKEAQEEAEELVIPGLEGFEMPEVTTGGELMGMEGDNLDLERILSQASSSQTVVSQTNAPSSSNRTNTTIIQQPRTPASNVLSGDFAFAR